MSLADSVFLVKEGYPDYDIRTIHKIYESARKAAEHDHSGYKLPFVIEEWRLEIDGGRPHNQWVLGEGDTGWRQTIKAGEWLIS